MDKNQLIEQKKRKLRVLSHPNQALLSVRLKLNDGHSIREVGACAAGARSHYQWTGTKWNEAVVQTTDLADFDAYLLRLFEHGSTVHVALAHFCKELKQARSPYHTIHRQTFMSKIRELILLEVLAVND
jgi:hypothetical protein